MASISSGYGGLARFIEPGCPRSVPATATTQRENRAPPIAEDGQLSRLVAPPTTTRPGISHLQYYQPEHIGPLVAIEFLSEANRLKCRSGMEALLTTVSFLGGSSVISALNIAHIDGPLAFAASLTAAALAGATTWALRRTQGTPASDFAQSIAKYNFEHRPQSESCAEAFHISQDPDACTSTRMVAIRQMLTSGPLFYGDERLLNASRALTAASSHFPRSLIHVDAVLEMMRAVQSTYTNKDDIELLQQNLIEVCRRGDIFNRLDRWLFQPAVTERSKELGQAAADLALGLFQTKFSDPTVKCSALNLSRLIVENLAFGQTAEEKVTLKALKENIIEVFLATIPLIKDAPSRLEQVEIAAHIKGLGRDQVSIIKEWQTPNDPPPTDTPGSTGSIPLVAPAHKKIVKSAA